MENLIKELEAIMFDVKSVEARTGGYKKDIDRGINSCLLYTSPSPRDS